MRPSVYCGGMTLTFPQVHPEVSGVVGASMRDTARFVLGVLVAVGATVALGTAVTPEMSAQMPAALLHPAAAAKLAPLLLLAYGLYAAAQAVVLRRADLRPMLGMTLFAAFWLAAPPLAAWQLLTVCFALHASVRLAFALRR